MYWEPSYIILILFSTIVDYFVAINIEKKQSVKDRKYLLFFSLFLNLGLLFTFKYFNFFSEFVFEFLPGIFPNNKPLLVTFLLPVGISFYTFQTLSYTIDVYKGEQKAEKDFFKFALYVTYFPQLVAGPIERSQNLLPQIQEKLTIDFSKVSFCFRMFIWGMFKKIVVADNISTYVDLMFNTQFKQSSLSLFIGSVLFSLQIYCDFSGYSDMAIGVSRLFGVRLMDNFKTPYYAKSMSEHWQRWHISLSSWFRDYVYIPIGGSKGGNLRTLLNVLITFSVSGIWHGANWTFLAWGSIHGVFVGIEKFVKLPFKLPNLLKVFFVFNIANFAFIIFRANNITHAIDYISRMFSFVGGPVYSVFELIKFLPAIFILLIIDGFLQKESIGNKLSNLHIVPRYLFYIFILHMILQNGAFHGNSFIYFQF